jgi:hypothetical protein
MPWHRDGRRCVTMIAGMLRYPHDVCQMYNCGACDCGGIDCLCTTRCKPFFLLDDIHVVLVARHAPPVFARPPCGSHISVVFLR